MNIKKFKIRLCALIRDLNDEINNFSEDCEHEFRILETISKTENKEQTKIKLNEIKEKIFNSFDKSEASLFKMCALILYLNSDSITKLFESIEKIDDIENIKEGANIFNMLTTIFKKQSLDLQKIEEATINDEYTKQQNSRKKNITKDSIYDLSDALKKCKTIGDIEKLLDNEN